VSQLENQPTKTVGDTESIEFWSKLGLILETFAFSFTFEGFLTPKFGRNLVGKAFCDTPDKIFCTSSNISLSLTQYYFRI